MKKFILFILTLSSFITYGQISVDSILNKKRPVLHDSTKVAFYKEQMKKKNFTISQLSTNIESRPSNEYSYESNVPFIYYLDFSDSLITIKFWLLGSCCQYHLGDYEIKKGTLTFEYENVMGGCFCQQWYNYTLKIPNTTEVINHIIIRNKKDKWWSTKKISKESRYYYKSTNKINVY